MSHVTNKLERRQLNSKHTDTWTSFTTQSIPTKHKHSATNSYRTKAEKAERDLHKLLKEEWK